MAGLLAGAALSTKYSAVWLAPMLVIDYVDLSRPARSMDITREDVDRGRPAGVVVIWGTFAFSIGPITPGGLAVPAPQYWQSVGKVANRVESSTPAFMLGQISPTGFPLYYPFVFLVKTPLPTLILLGVRCDQA